MLPVFQSSMPCNILLNRVQNVWVRWTQMLTCSWIAMIPCWWRFSSSFNTLLCGSAVGSLFIPQKRSHVINSWELEGDQASLKVKITEQLTIFLGHMYCLVTGAWPVLCISQDSWLPMSPRECPGKLCLIRTQWFCWCQLLLGAWT